MAQVKWYLKPVSVIIGILVLGPFALPLIWMSPALKMWQKIALTVLTAALTVWMVGESAKMFQSVLKHIQDLQAAM